MAVNPNNLLGQSNPNGTVGVSLGIDPAGANEAFSAGATSGFYVTPTSPAGMSVQVGGAVGVIDSALVRSASGITFPVGNVTGTPITLTVPAAPSTNSRIDSVVLYVDTAVTATATDGANAVGMEIVSGTSASSPVPPTEQQIRSAIQDGASIAYTVLANITVSSSTSTITASNISQANRAQLAADKIDFATYAEMSGLTSNIVISGSSSKEMTGFTNGSTTGNKLSINKSTGKINVNHSGLLMPVASSFQNSTSNAYIGMDILKGSTTIATSFRSMPTSYGGIGPAIAYVQAEVGDSFSVKITSPSNVTTTLNAGYASRHYFQAILLG